MSTEIPQSIREMKTPLNVLKEKFGYSSFRFEQEKAINNLLEGKDTFVLMPTGGGKSLCYQVPALVFEGLTVVISPLISLMKDQVDGLRLNGIEAACLNSSVGMGEQLEIIAKMRSGKMKLLYVAPEKFFGKEQQFIELLKTVNVSLFAVDEAHCISQWGHDFRPEYLMIGTMRSHFPNVPMIALTATADEVTRKDIIRQLYLKDPQIFLSSFNRPNIHYTVEPKKDSYNMMVKYLRARKDDSGVIYAFSRKSVEELAAKLRLEGFSVRPYHAGLDKKTREENQEFFIKDKVKIIVATIAFGMGIDKSNVRYVIHADLPKNIEGYYQETGRAGRDGLKSEAILFYSSADLFKLKRFMEGDNAEQTELMFKKLNKMAEYCEIKTCRRKFLLEYFDEFYPDNCGSCDVCLTSYQKVDATLIAQKALSAVSRLEEKFGINYVVDFLRGSKSEKIFYTHKGLKTYGIGADLSKEQWVNYLRELINEGYLKQEGEPYPILKLTEKSWPVLQGEKRVSLVENTGQQKTSDIPQYNAALFNELKVLRNQLAEEENVPAYIVLSDLTLQELATYLPSKVEELSNITGFGEIKTQRYGAFFIENIVKFCTKNSLKSRVDQIPTQVITKPVSLTTDTKLETLNLFKVGNSLKEIAEKRNLAVSTIETHLAHFISEGELEIEALVDKEKIAAIEEAIKEHGDSLLTPLKAVLGEKYTYGDIRAVVNYLKRKKSLKIEL